MRRQDDDVQLAMNSVRALEPAIADLIKGVTFIIDSNGQSAEFVRLLRSQLEQRMGNTVVRLGIIVDDGQVAIADLASSLEWQLNKEQFADLRQHPAVRDVQFTIPQPSAPQPSWGR